MIKAVVATRFGVIPTNHSAPFLLSLPVLRSMPGAVPVLPAIRLECAWYHGANSTLDVPGGWVSPVRMPTASRATCGLMTWTLGVCGTEMGWPELSVMDWIGVGAL